MQNEWLQAHEIVGQGDRRHRSNFPSDNTDGRLILQVHDILAL